MERNYESQLQKASKRYTKFRVMKLLTLFSTGTFIILAACCMQKEAAKEQLSLYDTKWDLKKIYPSSGNENVNTKAFIRFNKEKGSAGGNGSCNSFGSTAVVSGNTVTLSNIFSTKMYCEAVQPIEDAYLGQLGKVNRYEVDDKKLLLFHDKDLLLEFEAEGAISN